MPPHRSRQMGQRRLQDLDPDSRPRSPRRVGTLEQTQSSERRRCELVANSNVQTHPPSEKKTLWAWLIGTFFGAGLLKPGPGTYGSISAVLLWYATAHTFHPAPIALAA